MAQYLIEENTFVDIANKLREKSGKTGEIKGSDFVSEIDNLEKINNSEVVKAIAQDKIQIGDTIYVVDNSPRDIYANNSNTVFNDRVRSAVFSPNGKILVLSGDFSGKAKVYSVNENIITYVSNIYRNNNNADFGAVVNFATFSPDGKLLVLGGAFDNYAKVYSVNGTTITYISDIYANNSNTALNGYVNSAAFSPDGNTLVLVGDFSGRAKIYSVNGTTITYVSDIYANNSNTAINNNVKLVAFSPNGNTLVLGGNFDGYAKAYSVNGTTITYVSDIYRNNSNTALNSSVYSVTFSPDGNTLVLGGGFSDRAKVYSVNDTNITYISNIYANNSSGNTFNGSVSLASFSPDGKALILGGSFTGYAKIYSVEGANITYVSDIYADNNGTTLNGFINTVAFSPDGNTLVLGGDFSRYAKACFISGTSISKSTTHLVPNGEFTILPYGSKLGFAKSAGDIGEEVTIKTIGTVAIDYEAAI